MRVIFADRFFEIANPTTRITIRIMSDQENTDPLKDLEMAFLPQWAQEPNDAKPYADFAGDDRPRGRGRGDWGDRPRRRDDNRGRDFGS